jgi:hypothetical protein
VQQLQLVIDMCVVVWSSVCGVQRISARCGDGMHPVEGTLELCIA